MAMQSTLKQNIRTAVTFILASLSIMRYTERVNKLTNVSRSEVVAKILLSLSFMTRHITSIAVWICAVESQEPSFEAVFFVPLGPFLVGAAGFSAAFVSTADTDHCNKKTYISSNCLWWAKVSCSSLSTS